MFEQIKGRHDAKCDIFTIDTAMGLAFSPFTARMIDKARKKKQRLTSAINGRRTQAIESRLAESLSSVHTIADHRDNDDPVSKGFSDFILYQKQSAIVSNYVTLFQSYAKYVGAYKRYLQKLENRLFSYFSGASLYVRIDPKVNSDITRLDPGLREPPMIPGLQALYDRIPEYLRETLPTITI
ncbi:MAG: hypothetical protein II059_09600 [Clostridia bacterium]|nr:hypothetical protein [Clostridia bacterium]